MKKDIIFCVDDEKIVLNAIKSELKNSFGDKYVIETAENCQEALDTIDELLASGFQIPLIISDYSMPGMKGDELLTLTHKKTPKTLNLLLTGQASMEGVANVINNATLYRFIAKPWESRDLILTIEQALISYYRESQLELKNNELSELSLSLEKKVEKRTMELLSMNELLLEKQKEITISNEELSLAKYKAEESDRLKSAFLANVSHEIRTPLNSIIGFAELLGKSVKTEKDHKYSELIISGGRNLLSLINDILDSV